MKTDVNNPCLICGSTSSKTFFSREYPELDYPGEFCMSKCIQCGLFYNSPRLTEDAIAQLYDKNYYFFHRKSGDEILRMIPMYQQTIGSLTPEMPVGKVLEIGSAKGYFLAVLKKLGWTVYGVEISPTANQFAREKFNIPVFTGTLEEYAAQSNFESWPLVLAFDVLEHVTNPDDFISQLNRVTQIGGTVIIMTPNGAAANIEWLKADWPGFNPFHIFLFSPQNITQLLNKHGFQVQKIFSYNNARKTQDSIPHPEQNLLYGFMKILLRKMKLINFIKNVRLQIWQQKETDQVEYLLDRAIYEIKKDSNYFFSTDSQGEFALTCTGDNMVIVAKKRQQND